jgi:hypothetical protein
VKWFCRFCFHKAAAHTLYCPHCHKQNAMRFLRVNVKGAARAPDKKRGPLPRTG